MLLWAFAVPIPNSKEQSRRGPRIYLAYALYAAAGLVAVAGYFIDYQRPKIAPPAARLSQLPQVSEFIIVWLGAVVRSPFVNVHLCGILASVLIIATVAGSVAVLRRNKERWTVYYPWLLLLAFALSSGALTAVGRVNIGVDNVFNTWFDGFSGIRYNATSVFVYVAVIGLVYNLYQDRFRSHPVLRSRFLVGAAVAYTLLAVAWIEMSSDELTRVKIFQANRRRARTAVIWINALPDNPEIFKAYPYPDGMPSRVEQMRAVGLLKVPKVSESLRKMIATFPNGAKVETGRLEVGKPLDAGQVWFSGWARNPLEQVAADYVVLGWAEPDNSFHPFTAIPTGGVRSEIAEIYGPQSRKAGFNQEIDVSKLPQHGATIKAWAIDWQLQQAFPMAGTVDIGSGNNQ
jgi:hypothetical protein